MTETRQYSRLNGPRSAGGPSGPRTAGSPSERRLPSPPALHVSANGSSHADSTPVSSAVSGKQRSPLPVPPSIDYNARRASVALGDDVQPLPRGGPRPMPPSPPQPVSQRRASATFLPQPPSQPSNGASYHARSDSYSRNPAHSQAQAAMNPPPPPPANASQPGQAPDVQQAPATSGPQNSLSVPSAQGSSSYSLPRGYQPQRESAIEMLASPISPAAYRRPDQNARGDGRSQSLLDTSQPQPPSQPPPQPSQSAAEPVPSSSGWTPRHAPSAAVPPPGVAMQAPAATRAGMASTPDLLVAARRSTSPPSVNETQPSPPAGPNGLTAAPGPPVPARTPDIRQYAQRSWPEGGPARGPSLSDTMADLSLKAQTPWEPPRIRTPPQPPVTPPSHHGLAPSATPQPRPTSPRPTIVTTRISQDAVEQSDSALAPFSPTMESTTTSSVLSDRDDFEFDENPEYDPPPYQPAASSGPAASYVSPATVRAPSRAGGVASSPSTTSPTSTIARQTSIMANDVPITRLPSVRPAPSDGTARPPSEVLAVAVAATQQAATVRESMLPPVRENEAAAATSPAEDPEVLFHSPPPHLTVIGSGCFLLAYDYRPGPVPDWDTPVRVILNSKSQEVIIHEHQDTPTWRRNETREYIKMLIELHNEVVEEIDDSYAAFGSRGGEATGLGVGAQIRTDPPRAPSAAGPSSPSTAQEFYSPVPSVPAHVPQNRSPHQQQSPPFQQNIPPQPTGSSTQSINVNLTGPRPAIICHRIARLAFGVETPNMARPPWLIDATAYIMSAQLLIIDCHNDTPEPLRQALVGAFGASYGTLCTSLAEIEQTIVNAFPNDARLHQLEVSVPQNTAPNMSRLVINIRTAGVRIPANPWPAPQLFQTSPQSFQLVFPPRSDNGSDSPWALGRQVNIELNPPRADCGNPAPPQEFRSYIDLFVLALQQVFLPPGTVPIPGQPQSAPGSALSAGADVPPSPASRLSNGSSSDVARPNVSPAANRAVSPAANRAMSPGPNRAVSPQAQRAQSPGLPGFVPRIKSRRRQSTTSPRTSLQSERPQPMTMTTSPQSTSPQQQQPQAPQQSQQPLAQLERTQSLQQQAAPALFPAQPQRAGGSVPVPGQPTMPALPGQPGQPMYVQPGYPQPMQYPGRPVMYAQPAQAQSMFFQPGHMPAQLMQPNPTGQPGQGYMQQYMQPNASGTFQPRPPQQVGGVPSDKDKDCKVM